MSASEFWNELKERRVPLPLVPVLVEDAYLAYRHWCARAGRGRPDSLKDFVVRFRRAAGIYRVDVQIADAAGARRRRRVFLLGAWLIDQAAEAQRIAAGVAEFQRALLAYAELGS